MRPYLLTLWSWCCCCCCSGAETRKREPLETSLSSSTSVQQWSSEQLQLSCLMLRCLREPSKSTAAKSCRLPDSAKNCRGYRTSDPSKPSWTPLRSSRLEASKWNV